MILHQLSRGIFRANSNIIMQEECSFKDLSRQHERPTIPMLHSIMKNMLLSNSDRIRKKVQGMLKALTDFPKVSICYEFPQQTLSRKFSFTLLLGFAVQNFNNLHRVFIVRYVCSTRKISQHPTFIPIFTLFWSNSSRISIAMIHTSKPARIFRG